MITRHLTNGNLLPPTFRKRVTCLMRLPKKRLTVKIHQVISKHYRIAHKTCTVYPINIHTASLCFVACYLFSIISDNSFNITQCFFIGFEIMMCCARDLFLKYKATNVWYQTSTKYNKSWTMCIIAEMYCILRKTSLCFKYILHRAFLISS